MNAELASLPDAITRFRFLSIKASAEYLGVSVNTCRRMYGAGVLPRPTRLNGRKLGYQIGTLIDWADARAKASGTDSASAA